MRKRSESPRMVQQDLFATRPPLPLASPPDPVVAAAQEVEQVRRRRSQVVVPHVTGPASDARGGPLSAEEASRVLSGKTIRCSGFQFQAGAAVCKLCFTGLTEQQVDSLHAEHGYRATLYGGAEYQGGLDCLSCKCPIAM